MNWLLQNWLWVLLATFALAYLVRRNWIHHGRGSDSVAGGIVRGGGLGDHGDHGKNTNDDGPAGHRTAQADIPGAERRGLPVEDSESVPRHHRRHRC